MSGTSAAEAWTAALDTLESELLAVERADGATHRASTFVPPDLGPLPAQCADRARSLLSRLTSLESEIREDAARTGAQLRELRHLDPRAPRPASSIDTKA